jgi:hypothetical protein
VSVGVFPSCVASPRNDSLTTSFLEMSWAFFMQIQTDANWILIFFVFYFIIDSNIPPVLLYCEIRVDFASKGRKVFLMWIRFFPILLKATNLQHLPWLLILSLFFNFFHYFWNIIPYIYCCSNCLD